MPKPFTNDAGSGMHAHLACYRNGDNAFHDPDDPYRLSQTARYFIGGILAHAPAIAAIANPTVNSYKRLIPHSEAPVYIAWAGHNRSSLIRIPAKNDVDIEIRNADPAANPYFFYAALIHAGLDGIKKKRTYEPVEHNLYHMTPEQLAEAGVAKLPTNLIDSLEALAADAVITQAIGREATALFIERKTREWNEYMNEVTDADYLFYYNI
jgi:glutamine synthetase